MSPKPELFRGYLSENVLKTYRIWVQIPSSSVATVVERLNNVAYLSRDRDFKQTGQFDNECEARAVPWQLQWKRLKAYHTWESGSCIFFNTETFVELFVVMGMFHRRLCWMAMITQPTSLLPSTVILSELLTTVP